MLFICGGGILFWKEAAFLSQRFLHLHCVLLSFDCENKSNYTTEIK